MIIGLGTDIAEVHRIAKSIENISFKERVFSKSEIAYCDTKVNKEESYTARFAAKEAFFKALGTGWRGGMSFNEVEVWNDELGKPTLNILGETAEIIKERNIKTIHVSLSHIKNVAMATVILED
ncbi:MAG: acpS [Bacteroidetes bacterium]|jgi:holo-[acyl-carrier protein] synthase|nr:acpS [Bacteroidota bacterium]